MPPAPRESVKLSARVPSDHFHAMQVIVQKPTTPWETASDLLRHFIEEGVARLAEWEQDPDILHWASILIALRDLERLDGYEKANNRAIALRSQLHQAEQSGDERWIGETRETIRQFMNVIPYRTITDRLGREI